MLLQNRNSSHLSGQLSAKVAQSDRKRKCQLVKFWPRFFWDSRGVLLIDCLEKGRIINITLRYWCDWRKKLQKTIPNKEESPLSPRKCTVSQVDGNDGQIAQIAFWFASSSTVFTGSRSQQLLPVCRPEKNAPKEDIWLKWRSDCRNWSLFWGQRQIILQKRHCNVREASE